jgi:Zn-dependent M28 family amino/carboxypeptidase
VATPANGVEAEVVLFESLAALRAAPDDSLKGKIAYVGHAMKRTQDGSSYGHFVRLRSAGAVEAGRRGAIATLIRSIGTDSHRMPHTGNMSYSSDVTPIPIAALSNPDADQLERMAQRGQSIRVKLTLTPSYTGVVESGNVVAELPGSDLADELVVIGGHLDSWDLGTGAIDDGAGVAITMEVLRRIKEAGLKPRRTIRLVLWGSEEVGLLGGYAYADKHKDTLRNHVIGTESDFGAGRIWKITRNISEQAKPVADKIAELVEPLGIAPGSNSARSSGPDLSPMNAKGFPGFRFVQDGSDYFDLHHTPDDTLDKIDPAAMDQNVAAYLVFVWMAANSNVSDWGWPVEQ